LDPDMPRRAIRTFMSLPVLVRGLWLFAAVPGVRGHGRDDAVTRLRWTSLPSL
jgi:hypothetical protein